MEQTNVIQVNDLVKVFDGREVISHCNMNVPKGNIYGFLGANGAGKTTVLKMLIGLLKPTSGSIMFKDKPITDDYNLILRGSGNIIETPVFYEHLSAKENLEIHLSYMQCVNNNIDETLHRVGLKSVGTQPVSNFSLGMKQRLGIARAMVHHPELLILDEPINGLDPMGIREMRDLFLSLAHEHNMTIIISSHLLSEMEQIADIIGVIINGKIAKEVTLAEIRQSFPNGLEDYFFQIMNGGNADA